MHLSSASALGSIKQARASGIPLTIETTHHYLSLSAEDVPDCATQFKCCPPIRNKQNQVSSDNEELHTYIYMVIKLLLLLLLLYRENIMTCNSF